MIVTLSQKMEAFYADKLPTAQIQGTLGHSQRSLQEISSSYQKCLGSAQAENEKNRQLEQQKHEELQNERHKLGSERHKRDLKHIKFKSSDRDRHDSNDEPSKSTSSKTDDYRKRDYGDRTDYYRDTAKNDGRERSKSYQEPHRGASPSRRNSEISPSSSSRDGSDRRASGFMNAYLTNREHERDKSTKSTSSSLKIDPNEKSSIDHHRRPP